MIYKQLILPAVILGFSLAETAYAGRVYLCSAKDAAPFLAISCVEYGAIPSRVVPVPGSMGPKDQVVFAGLFLEAEREERVASICDAARRELQAKSGRITQKDYERVSRVITDLKCEGNK